MARYRYEVSVTGHEPPFKWTIFRQKIDEHSSKQTCGSGSSDSYEDALFDTAYKARGVEWERRHCEVIRNETLFEVDDADHVTID